MPATDTDFKSAMRLLAGGVTIVATRYGTERSGLTATAICSLALSPARLLACVNMAGRTFAHVTQSRCMSVNLLAEDHGALAQRFAGHSGENRFAGAEWRTRVTGAPLLADALAAFDCRVSDIVPVGTHAVLIGLVEHVDFGPRRAPLIHFDGDCTSIPSPLLETAP